MSINAFSYHSGIASMERISGDVAEMVSRRRFIVGGLGAAALAGAGGLGWSYSAAMTAARQRLTVTPHSTIQTRFGALQYADVGVGAPLLMVHGSGGGFDQGLMFSRGLAAAGYRIIAPSRFGYLGSHYPQDASPDNQADAFVELLDHLEIDRIAIAGMSAGALSALAFAIRHPDRCAALLPIVPAAWRPDMETAVPWSPLQTFAVTTVLRSDFLFWCAITFARDFVTRSILATNPALFLGAEGQKALEEVSHSILPISARADGLLNDMQNTGSPPRYDLSRITAPTLAISAEDDLYFTASTARYIAETTPNARAIVYRNGGHLLVSREAEMTAAIQAFLEETGYS